MNDKIKQFEIHIDNYDYDHAAQMYYDLAYMHRDSFNKILNERNVKDKVIDLMYSIIECEHTDQI